MTLRPTASRLCDWLVHKLVASLSLSLLEEILFVLSTPRHTRATRSLTRIHAPLRDMQSFAKKRKVAGARCVFAFFARSLSISCTRHISISLSRKYGAAPYSRRPSRVTGIEAVQIQVGDSATRRNIDYLIFLI